jgi:ABC-2 type transport system permease protein
MSTIDTFISTSPSRRLFAVELRKLVNTRAGTWLVAGMLMVLCLMTVAMVTTGGAEHLSFQNMWGMLNLPMSFLLPILAILLITSEWSQRTALVTFALEPRRKRVLAAKMATSVALTLAVLLVTAALAAVGTWLALTLRTGTPGWRLDGAVGRNLVMLQFARIIEGFAFGLLIRNSAVAIVSFLALPTAWTLLGSLIPWAGDHLRPWIDFAHAENPFQNGEAPFESASALTATDWAHLAVSLTIWAGVPLLIGARRLMRVEVK